ACKDSNISFDTLLLDYGNLTDPNETRRSADLTLIRSWIDIASICGAKQIRIIAGEAHHSDAEAIAQSAASLAELAKYSSTKSVRVITENFKPLTSTSESSLMLLEQAGRK